MQEAYAQVRAQGVGPAQAAQRTGLQGYRGVERQVAFRERLRELTGDVVDDPGVTLQWLVSELKRTVHGARTAGQYKNANEATKQLAELYAKHPELRGDKDAARPALVISAAEQLERRAQREARLSVAAANE